ncbi:MAG: thiosulfohydrolase SoxB [Xanthomonadales bacterium]|nr:thiosulfohydrolase SoxB [Gammaproteobacteria bacterium]NNK03735.1 thiosulfohydrolase SoxB [Xanthomonadales bacterium]NNK99945.1 thiosulfohydrolase SoxB [Xanthomonadales bacterium]
MDRREFLTILGAAGAAGLLPACTTAGQPREDLYTLPPFGNARVLHFTDSHAQLEPVYFREPNVNIGIGPAIGRPPHLVGKRLLEHAGLASGTAKAHAFTYMDFAAAAKMYGKVGGFAHLKTLVDQQRAQVPEGQSLLLDGGDTWQGSATALWTRGKDMVGACNLLGVDIMTGHWEFTYQQEEILENISEFKGEFIAQNVRVSEEALFDGAEAYDEDSGHAFKPYTIREMGGRKVAVIGQAFPYTPIANPGRFIPDWSFGIRDSDMQELVDEIRAQHRPDAVIVLSHNGMDVDIKMASVVTGVDVILGGHTHDAVPKPVMVDNSGGKTLVSNAGSNGKFLAVLDLDIGEGKINDYRYRLLPVFSNLLEADAGMQAYIDGVRRPYLDQLNESLAVADSLLYRRGNFNGTFDQLICDAMREVGDAEIALSPGFRWGTSILPGQTITMERLMDQTAMTYPETYVRDMQGSELKMILESVADNLFHPDPYYQQGGDMVRVGGLSYSCDPGQEMGKRITNLSLADGRTLEADKTYKVAGWATVASKAPGPPIWEVVAEYLRDQKVVRIDKLDTPRLINVAGNPGVADYSGPIS